MQTPDPPADATSGQPTGRRRIGDALRPHLALVLGALATGCTRLTGLPETDDVLATVRALEALGVPIARRGETWEVRGRGAGGLAQPAGPVDLGAAGCGMPLVLAAIAGQPIAVDVAGPLSAGEALAPLRQMGLQVLRELGSSATVRGADTLLPISASLPQGASPAMAAILVAGLAAPGHTSVTGAPIPDGMVDLFRMLGADVRSTGETVTVHGETELSAADVAVA